MSNPHRVQKAGLVLSTAAIAGGLSACGSDGSDVDEATTEPTLVTKTVTETATATASSTTSAIAENPTTVSESDVVATPPPTMTTPPPTTAEATSRSMSTSQRNAVAKGRDYLTISAFSRQGLIEQLVYEGFSNGDATFAVDYLNPNWTEQARKKAADYMSMSAFSEQGLVEQLVYEGFTRDQAAAGAASQF